MKQATTFLLIAIGWIILFNCIILNFLINEEPLLTNNLITGAVTKDIVLSPWVGRIIVPLFVFNILMIILLIIGYKIQIKNNKLKFEF